MLLAALAAALAAVAAAAASTDCLRLSIVVGGEGILSKSLSAFSSGESTRDQGSNMNVWPD